MREFVRRDFKHGPGETKLSHHDEHAAVRTVVLTPKGNHQAFLQSLERIRNACSAQSPSQGRQP